jgi:hypothetical protein
MLTTEQKATLKAFVEADQTLNQIPKTYDGAYALAEALKVAASPAFTVWRTDVPAGDIGNAWSGADIDGMSALNMQRLQLLLASSPDGTFNMSRIDRRTGFLNPFGVNANNASRVAMNVVFRRLANVLEKLFSTGTGTNDTPATLTVEGSLSYQEVHEAMEW